MWMKYSYYYVDSSKWQNLVTFSDITQVCLPTCWPRDLRAAFSFSFSDGSGGEEKYGNGADMTLSIAVFQSVARLLSNDKRGESSTTHERCLFWYALPTCWEHFRVSNQEENVKERFAETAISLSQPQRTTSRFRTVLEFASPRAHCSWSCCCLCLCLLCGCLCLFVRLIVYYLFCYFYVFSICGCVFLLGSARLSCVCFLFIKKKWVYAFSFVTFGAFVCLFLLTVRWLFVRSSLIIFLFSFIKYIKVLRITIAY